MKHISEGSFGNGGHKDINDSSDTSSTQSPDYIYYKANQIIYWLAGFNASFAVKINHIGLTTKNNGGIMVSDVQNYGILIWNGK